MLALYAPQYALFVCLFLGGTRNTGNKAAGVRARKWLQDLKQLAQDLRIAIQRCKTENEQARLADWHAAPQVPDVSHMHEAVGRMEDFVGGPVQVFDGALIGANGVVLSSSMDAVAAPTMDADVAHASGLPLAPHAHPTH